jgi:hypothetical protein
MFYVLFKRTLKRRAKTELVRKYHVALYASHAALKTLT